MEYTGAVLHGVNRTNVKEGELGDVTSLNLGMIPEDVLKEKVYPIVENLNAVLNEYNVYIWTTVGYENLQTMKSE